MHRNPGPNLPAMCWRKIFALSRLSDAAGVNASPRTEESTGEPFTRCHLQYEAETACFMYSIPQRDGRITVYY